MEAAQYAAESAMGALRTAETIQKFQALPKPEGGVAPILQYFHVLLGTTSLNAIEAVEVARPAVQQVSTL